MEEILQFWEEIFKLTDENQWKGNIKNCRCCNHSCSSGIIHIHKACSKTSTVAKIAS